MHALSLSLNFYTTAFSFLFKNILILAHKVVFIKGKYLKLRCKMMRIKNKEDELH